MLSHPHSAARYNKWRVIGGYISSGRWRCDAGVSGYRTSSTTCNVATWGQRLHLFEEGRIEGARERWVGFPSPLSSATQFRFEFISTPARHMINWLLARGRSRSSEVTPVKTKHLGRALESERQIWWDKHSGLQRPALKFNINKSEHNCVHIGMTELYLCCGNFAFYMHKSDWAGGGERLNWFYVRYAVVKW